MLLFFFGQKALFSVYGCLCLSRRVISCACGMVRFLAVAAPFCGRKFEAIGCGKSFGRVRFLRLSLLLLFFFALPLALLNSTAQFCWAR